MTKSIFKLKNNNHILSPICHDIKIILFIFLIIFAIFYINSYQETHDKRPIMKALLHHYENLNIKPSDLKKIIMGHELVHFSKNEYLLRKDDKAHEYYILEGGLIRSFIQKNLL